MSIQLTIEQKLQQAFQPATLSVVNESHTHNVPPNSETHFKLVIVSTAFDGLRLIQRHRQVNDVLAAELIGPVHALAMHTYTPSEWEKREENSPLSPKCKGG